MKVALVHDHLAQDGGAERVLKVFAEMFPQAPIYTLLYKKDTTNPFFKNKDIRASFIQKMPLGLRKYQWYLPLMPSAIESLDLNEYDLVLSSSSMFAKGVITRTDALHICYCHTPTRFLWSDTHSYVRDLNLPGIIKKLIPILLSRMRVIDKDMSERVDVFIANSKTVQRRIAKYYAKESIVIYPPVDLSTFRISDKLGNYYLTGGRLVSYKRFDIAVKAFSRMNIPLKIFGDGPVYKELKALAKSNIEFVGKISEEEKADLFSKCLAFINPQVEDFGITAIEAMASGRPVIAYAAGGTPEALIEGKTGFLFYRQCWEDLANAVIWFHNKYRFKINPDFIREHAYKFSKERFVQEIKNLIEEKSNQFFIYPHIAPSLSVDKQKSLL